MDSYGGSVSTAALMLNLSTRCLYVVNFMLRPVFPKTENPVPSKYEAIGPVGSVDALEQRKNILPLPGVKPRFVGRVNRSTVTVLTELHTHWR